ncbi:MAG TPA: hypothetical protein VIV60_11925, partial [Polyangiaceae bacterium]
MRPRTAPRAPLNYGMVSAQARGGNSAQGQSMDGSDFGGFRRSSVAPGPSDTWPIHRTQHSAAHRQADNTVDSTPTAEPRSRCLEANE